MPEEIPYKVQEILNRKSQVVQIKQKQYLKEIKVIREHISSSQNFIEEMDNSKDE